MTAELHRLPTINEKPWQPYYECYGSSFHGDDAPHLMRESQVHHLNQEKAQWRRRDGTNPTVVPFRRPPR